MAIGQGEIETTPLQMANMTAAIANRGYYYIPHIVKSIGPDKPVDQKYMTKHSISIDSANFETIILGMETAVNGEGGATARIAALKDISLR
jgi:penicillin-binding protein 2